MVRKSDKPLDAFEVRAMTTNDPESVITLARCAMPYGGVRLALRSRTKGLPVLLHSWEINAGAMPQGVVDDVVATVHKGIIEWLTAYPGIQLILEADPP